jgi:uncharacterized protein (TIGR02246 family)
MKKSLTIIPFVILLCFTFSCQQGEEVAEEVTVAPLSVEDVAAIKAIGPALDKADLALDWSALVELMTEDVLFMNPNSAAIQGRAAVKKSYESLGVTAVREHRHVLHEVEGYGDIAYARGTYEVEFSLEGVEEPVKDKGKTLLILRKQSGGSWLIAIFSFSTDLPYPSS